MEVSHTHYGNMNYQFICAAAFKMVYLEGYCNRKVKNELGLPVGIGQHLHFVSGSQEEDTATEESRFLLLTREAAFVSVINKYP